jgi:hypothetical protein
VILAALVVVAFALVAGISLVALHERQNADELTRALHHQQSRTEVCADAYFGEMDAYNSSNFASILFSDAYDRAVAGDSATAANSNGTGELLLKKARGEAKKADNRCTIDDSNQ